MSQSLSTSDKIAKQIDRLDTNAATGDSTARIQLDNAIDKLAQDTTALAKQLVPNKRVPIYVTPQSDQSRLDYTTWNELDPTGPYGAYDDNYCRVLPSTGANSGQQQSQQPVYPVRDVSSGRVSMEPCTGMLGPEVSRIANISEQLDRLFLIAKHRLLTEEASSSTSMQTTRETAESKIEEYERATRQYQKLAEMIDGFQEVTKRHQKIIDRGSDGNDVVDNNIAIQQDNLEEYLDEQKSIRDRNSRLLKWTRLPMFILWVIVLALFLLKQV